MDLFEDKSKMTKDDSDRFVTSAIAEPENKCFAQVPGLCKWDHHIQHAPSPSIGAKV